MAERSRCLSVYPDFEGFGEAAKHGNLVPVCAERLADLLTPVSAYLRVAARLRRPFLLESAEGGEHIGRYSFLGGEPFMEVEGDVDGLVVRYADGAERRVEGDPVRALTELHAGFRARPPAQAPPFTGGAVGYIGYDAIRWVEKIPANNPVEPDVPWAYLAYYDTILAFDHLRHRVVLVANARVGDAEDSAALAAAYEEALQKIDRLSELLDEPAEPAAPLDRVRGAEGIELHADESLNSEAFCAAVDAAKEYIAAGDAFQIVLSRRITCETVASPLSVYRALRAINPSPYMFMLDAGGTHVVGSSPEMLVRVADGVVENRPIAGTRPRGASPEEDQMLADQLLADEKERAEHLMLVDLGRNDVGRVSEYGTVRVPEFMKVERYSHVMHIVSSVTGSLRACYGPFEALFAAFPAGTVSGAPKIRAMEIIDELEPLARGVYAGAVLYADFAGNLDSCITIRTVVMRGMTAYVQAGAGIVADSQPLQEYDETNQKAAAVLQALAWADRAETLDDAELDGAEVAAAGGEPGIRDVLEGGSVKR